MQAQNFDLDHSFYFMSKNGKRFAIFLQILFLDLIEIELGP